MKRLNILGCAHIGHKNCDQEMLIRFLEQPGDFLLVGDLIECGVPSKANKMMEQDSIPQDQAIKAIGLLYPIKDRVIGMVTSNHSNRVWESVGIDIDYWIAHDLGIPYYGIMGKIMWEGKKIVFHHGNGGGMNEWSDAQRLLYTVPDADVIIVSHRHRLAQSNFCNELRGKSHRVDFIRTGSFIKEARYADTAIYQKTSLGGAAIEIDKFGRIIPDTTGYIKEQ